MLKRVAHSIGLVEHTNKDSRRKNQWKDSKASPEFCTQSRNFVVRISHAGGHQELYSHALPVSKLMTKYPGMCVATPEVFKIPHRSVLWHEDLLIPGHRYVLISFRDVEKLKRKHPEQGQSNEPNGMTAKEMLETKARSPSGHKENGTMHVPNGVAGNENFETKITNGYSHHHNENGKMKEPDGVAVACKETSVSPRGGKDQEKNMRVKEGVGEEIVDTNMDRSQGEGVVEDLFFSAKDFYVLKVKCTSTTTTRSSRRKGIKGKKPFVPPLPKARAYRSLGWQPSLPTVTELSP